MRRINKGSPTSRATTAFSRSKSPTRKTGTFDIRAYQKAIDLQKSLPMNSKQYTISAFHKNAPKWDGTNYPDPHLLNELYRIPCRDPTGKVIFNLLRDDGKLQKGQKAWKPADTCNDLPEPTFELCSVSFQKQALSHIIQAIARVEEQYRTMPGKTQEQSTLKAKVGADLNNLKMERDRIVEKIRNHPELLEHHKDVLDIITNTPKSPKRGH